MSAQEAQRQLATLGVPARQAAENLRRFAHHAGADPYGVRTIDGAKAAYVRGEIDLDEYERRVERLLDWKSATPSREDRELVQMLRREAR